MDNQEAIDYLSKEGKSVFQHDTDMLQAIDMGIEALKDVDRLEEENHRNFVNSQHIISSLIEEIKELRGEENG